MSDVRIVVQVAGERQGFTAEQPYVVVLIQNERFLVIDDHGRFAWLGADAVEPVLVERAGERLFDLEIHRNNRRLLDLVGHAIRFTTWEEIGFEPDSRTDEGMYVYRGVVDSYDGETLFLRRDDDSRFGVLPKDLATLEKEQAGEG